ncbi:MAG: PDDEXK nuclease domain-containing protein [Leucobacter sp.]
MTESVEPGPEQRSPARRSPGTPALGEGELVERVASLIDQAHESIASYANATLTMTYWQIGSLVDTEVLGGERADYGAQILVTLSHELSWSHFLGLHDDYLEADLEAAILRDLEAFLLEVGTGFTFVQRQKRMVIDGKDFHLDLLHAQGRHHRCGVLDGAAARLVA